MQQAWTRFYRGSVAIVDQVRTGVVPALSGQEQRGRNTHCCRSEHAVRPDDLRELACVPVLGSLGAEEVIANEPEAAHAVVPGHCKDDLPADLMAGGNLHHVHSDVDNRHQVAAQVAFDFLSRQIPINAGEDQIAGAEDFADLLPALRVNEDAAFWVNPLHKPPQDIDF